MTYPLPLDFQVSPHELAVIGREFNRPECVLALSTGELIASHGAGGYSVRSADGSLRHVIGRGEPGRRYVPNGIALAPDGRVLFADLGAEAGGIFAIEPDGQIVPVVTEVDGAPIPPSNFVIVDDRDVVWFTVSTRQHPRSLAWNARVTDGYIAVKDSRGVRIVADALGYTNEIAFSPDGHWVYTNETYAQCVSRFRLLPGPSLGPREVVVQLHGADLPDGIAFDEAGGAWISCIASNRVLVVRPDGQVQVVVSDMDPAHVAKVEAGVRARNLAHATMQTAGRSRLGNVSSLAFGGADRRTACLGCLLDDGIRTFQSPVPGMKPMHWDRRIKTI